jgi:hypothetical protein
MGLNALHDPLGIGEGIERGLLGDVHCGANFVRTVTGIGDPALVSAQGEALERQHLPYLGLVQHVESKFAR